MGKATERAGQDWCILRCAAPNTINLAKSLAAAGFDVWTPIETRQKRKGKQRDRIECEAPMMPTFTFARAEHLQDLLALTMANVRTYTTWDDDAAKFVTREHPAFSLFRHLNRFPLVADRHIEPLRVAERRSCPKEKARVFTPGEEVHLDEGGFAGMTGTIAEHKGRYVMVLFPGFSIPIKIEGALLPMKNAA